MNKPDGYIAGSLAACAVLQMQFVVSRAGAEMQACARSQRQVSGAVFGRIFEAGQCGMARLKELSGSTKETRMLMNTSPEQSVAFALQSSFHELLGLAEKAALNESDKERLKNEATETMCALIAAVVVADGNYSDGEDTLLTHIIEDREGRFSNMDFVREYASKWASASTEVPQFLKAAVQYDSANGTCTARSMLCAIQLVGNNASISDGNFSERPVVHNYIAHLEAFLDGRDLCRKMTS